MVCGDFVADAKTDWEAAVSIRCVHGDVEKYSLLKMRLEIYGRRMEVTAAV